MNWKAALPMYNVSPRVQREYEAMLACLLRDADADADLTAPRDLHAFWRQPDVLVTQTCGYPYMTFLRDAVTLLATPAYDFPGCEGSDYASAIVVRTDAAIQSLADARGLTAAVNDMHSNSGMNALRHAVAPLAHDGRFFGNVVWSGSHADSLRLVREGAADIAAIDCVTYGYLAREQPEHVQGVRVLQYTARSPGLPLVAARAVPSALIDSLRSALLKPGARLRAHMQALHIASFHARCADDYERVLRLEAEAVAARYPVLA